MCSNGDPYEIKRESLESTTRKQCSGLFWQFLKANSSPVSDK